MRDRIRIILYSSLMKYDRIIKLFHVVLLKKSIVRLERKIGIQPYALMEVVNAKERQQRPFTYTYHKINEILNFLIY